MNSEADPAPPSSGKFPFRAIFIVGTEACERFSFYGMTSILTLYLARQMKLGDSRATEIVHLFSMTIYFLPLVGGWLADRWLGRYRTILYLSLFYCLGHATLAGYGTTMPGVYLGLAFIAIGAGGIKPNVAAFLGDQFGDQKGPWLTRVYGWFYWSVNLGALFAFTQIPALRDRHGYAWAFGVPGIFMGLAALFFWSGTKSYVRVPSARATRQAGFFEMLLQGSRDVHPRTKYESGILFYIAFGLLGVFLNATWSVLACLLTDRRKLFEAVAKRYGPEQLESLKAVLRVLLIFATVPIFWALYFQVNTTWVFQAKKMERVFADEWYMVDAERMQSAGALLVLIWVPILTLWLYPLAERLGLRPTPLRRMGTGMVLAAAAFVICGILQIWLDRGHAVSILWQILPYTVLEAGEVLLSATALEFAFGQAPPTMKSTIMSFWFLTSSFGNFLVAAFTELNNRFFGAGGMAEFMFYAVLMFCAAGVFMLIASRYGSGRNGLPPTKSTA